VPAADMHAPVLLAEVLDFLAPASAGVYVDANLGMGGHSEAILERSEPGGRVVAFDLDATAIALARRRLARFGGRLTCVNDNFAAMPQRLRDLGLKKVDGILLDLGLSSYQLERSGRGFSFLADEPLDMRMDASQGPTAADLVNRAPEKDLADIFYYYGEERQARRIARFLVEQRKKRPLSTTADLVGVVERAVPPRFRPRKIHVATKVFQALRIVVNKELESLGVILDRAPEMLRNGSKICVISFHSLEDRLVKRAFKNTPALRVLTAKPVMAGDDELMVNPRARSAKLRVAEKVEHNDS